MAPRWLPRGQDLNERKKGAGMVLSLSARAKAREDERPSAYREPVCARRHRGAEGMVLEDEIFPSWLVWIFG
jgi:hypothetical protein